MKNPSLHIVRRNPPALPGIFSLSALFGAVSNKHVDFNKQMIDSSMART
jgi:hypothetical protein